MHSILIYTLLIRIGQHLQYTFLSSIRRLLHEDCALPMCPSDKRSKPKSQLTRRRLEQLLASSALVNDEDCQVFNLKIVLISAAAEQYLISATLKVKTIRMVMWILTALLLTRIKTTLAVTLKASLVVIWMVSALLLQHFKKLLAVPSLPVTLKPTVFVQMEHVTAST